MERDMSERLCYTCRKPIHQPYLFEAGQLCIGQEMTFEIVRFDKNNPSELVLKCVALNKRWREFNDSYPNGYKLGQIYVFKSNELGSWLSPNSLPWHLVDSCNFVHQF
jgi:hypothetical protein